LFKKPKEITAKKKMLIARETSEKILANVSEEEIIKVLDRLNGISMAEKMLLMCEKLGINDDLKVKALSLPKIRSRYAGHARLSEPSFNGQVLNDFMQVARKVVLSARATQSGSRK
jgi:hypothetical protein